MIQLEMADIKKWEKKKKLGKSGFEKMKKVSSTLFAVKLKPCNLGKHFNFSRKCEVLFWKSDSNLSWETQVENQKWKHSPEKQIEKALNDHGLHGVSHTDAIFLSPGLHLSLNGVEISMKYYL